MLVFGVAERCRCAIDLMNRIELASMDFQIDFSHLPQAARRWGLSLAIALGATSLAGTVALAQAFPDVEECNQFADSVNRNQTIMEQFEAEIAVFAENAATAETLSEITAAATQYVAALDEVTNNLDSLSTDVAALAFEDTQLTDYRDDYVDVVVGFNNALAIVSEAMTQVAAAETDEQLSASLAGVADDTSAAIEQIEVLAVDESELIDNVNDYCGAA